MSEATWIPGIGSKPAPGELREVQAFVNTIDFEEQVDKLATPEALRDWLAERGWMDPGERLSEADLHQALEVREAIRSLLLAHNGAPLDPAAVESLNHAAKSAEVLVRFGGDGSGALAAARPGIDGALGQILAIVFRSMADGSWERLKACPRHGCRWAFWDGSKNRSGTWCDMAICGNRAKAQAYRERHAGRR